MDEREFPPLEQAPLDEATVEDALSDDEDPSYGEFAPLDRRRRQRRRRRWRVVRWLLGLATLAVVFIVGLSLGRSLGEAPQPGGEQTIVRTLEPTILGPTKTVTVTVPEETTP
ncbi:MAG: hypothetical protein OXG37_10130 [Actinomycetia bacterium]|nr:hypothetical protein [Actinomycetes bacterium]